MAVDSGGARGAVAPFPSPHPSQENQPLKNTRNQSHTWTFGEFRYGVVWLPLKNHHLDPVRTWNGFRKWHFRASEFQQFLGEHAPNHPPPPPPPPPQPRDSRLRRSFCLPPAHKFLATAMQTHLPPTTAATLETLDNGPASLSSSAASGTAFLFGLVLKCRIIPGRSTWLLYPTSALRNGNAGRPGNNIARQQGSKCCFLKMNCILPVNRRPWSHTNTARLTGQTRDLRPERGIESGLSLVEIIVWIPPGPNSPRPSLFCFYCELSIPVKCSRFIGPFKCLLAD